MARLHGVFSSIPGILRGRGALALIDQVMLSGSNFISTVILVRGLGLAEFGKYSIAFVLLLYANAAQMSFVASPMLSIAPQLSGAEKRRFVDGMLTIQLIGSFGGLVIFAVAGAISRLFTNFYSVPCIIAFAFCVGTFQLQDWLRRYYFIYNKAALAIATDFISYFVQMVVLLLLWRIGHLTLFAAFLVMCTTSLAGFLIGPITDPLRPELATLRETWRHCRTLSRDLFIANQVRWLGVQGVFLIGTGIVGTVAAGGLRATLSLAGPLNLVLTSIENVVPIRIAEELQTTGGQGAFGFTRRTMLLSIGLLALLLVPIGLFGRSILRILYGPPMVAFYVPMLMQLLSILIQLAYNLWIYFFRAVRDTRALLGANALTAIVSLATVYPFGHFWGATGIAVSSMCGLGSAVLFLAWHWSRTKNELVLQYPGAAADGEVVYREAKTGAKPLSESQ